MKRYVAMLIPQDESMIVVEDAGQRNRRLDLRLDLMNHSPTGFSWGYAGSGPAQTALAILADFFAGRPTPKDHVALDDLGPYWPSKAKTEGDYLALQLYMRFKFEIIATFPMQEGFNITADRISEWAEPHLRKLEVERARENAARRADIDIRR